MPTHHRALLITDVTAPGGVDTYFCALYRAGVEAGWQVEAMVGRHPGSDGLYRRLMEAGAPVTRAPLYHRQHPEDVRAQATGELLDRFEPTVVHAVCGAPWTTVVPREVVVDRGIPLVFTEQFVAPGFIFPPRLRERIRDLYRRARAVIAVSKNNATLLTGEYGFPSDHLVVIPNAATCGDATAHSEQEIAALRDRLGLPEREFQAVTVARCVRQKGLDVLVEALAQLPEPQRRRIHFAVFGDGPERRALKQLASERGVTADITFYGWHDDASLLLPAFDLFVLPSRSEGQPFALIEAMAAGLPVIATSVSGIPELLAGGESGEPVTGEDPGELARAIAGFLKDPGRLRAKAKVGAAHVRRDYEAATNLGCTIALWGKP